MSSTPNKDLSLVWPLSASHSPDKLFYSHTFIPGTQHITIEPNPLVFLYMLREKAVVNGLPLLEGNFSCFENPTSNKPWEITTIENTKLLLISGSRQVLPEKLEISESQPIPNELFFLISKILLQLKDPIASYYTINNDIQLLKCLSIRQLQNQSPNKHGFEKICSVVESIERLKKLPFNTWSVSALVNLSQLSAYAYHVVLRDIYGLSAREMLNYLKMHHAANLLQNSVHSLSTIGTSIGFSSDMNFITAFKQHYHTTPGIFRKSYRR
jgi:AraC-like DNA-binding protein